MSEWDEVEYLRAEIRHLKSELVKSRDTYQGIFKHINSGITVFEAVDLGQDFVIQDLNPAQERINGWTREEIIGKRVTEVNPLVRGTGLFRALQRVWHTGRPETFSTTLYQGGKVAGMRDHKIFRLANGQLVLVDEDVSPLISELRQKQKTEEQIKAIFKAADRIAFVIAGRCEKGMRIQEFSPGAEKIFGYAKSEVIGRPISILHLPEDIERFSRIIDAEHPEGGISEECTLMRKSGETFPAFVSTYSIQDHEGRTSWVLWTTLDLTHIKMAERALMASEERFRTSFENAVVAMAVMDTDLSFLRVNDALCNLLGYSREELLSMSCLDITHHEDEDPTRHHIDAILEGRMDFVQFEKRYVHKSGRTVWVLKSCTLVRDPEGEPGYFLVQVVDITKRKAAEQALRESHERFTTVLDSLDACIYVIDTNTHEILFINRKTRETFGECVGEKCYKAFQKGQDDRCPFCPPPLASDTDGGQGVNVFELRNTLNGHWYELRDRVIRWVDGRFVRMVIASDITKRKRAEREQRMLERRIHQAQRLESLGILAGGIAHDFNNILMGILGNADLALMKLPAGSPLRPNIEKIEGAALRAAELTDQMLAYSGKGHFVIQPMDLSALVKEMAHFFETIVSKKVSLRYDLAGDLPLIEADPAQIRQVILNLISNASDAIGEAGGTITITTGTMEADRNYLGKTYLDDELPEGSYVFLEVSDTGSGMDGDTLSKIFDPFFSTKFPGRGLGLAAVLGIVRGHKGAIKVSSSQGEGTTLRVLFPHLPGQADRQGERVQVTTGLPGHGHGETILVVDDEETVLSVTEMMLRELGFRVLTARNGKEALEIFRKNPGDIDLVLLDMTMPVMNGEETLEGLRRLDQEARVVLSSGYDEKSAAKRFAGKDLAGFIQKPYRVEDLLSTLKKALSRPMKRTT